MFRDKIQQKLTELAPNLLNFEVNLPPERFGDFSTNLALVWAKKEKSQPLEKAERIRAKLQKDPEFNDLFSKIEIVAPGFINFFIKKEALWRTLSLMVDPEGFGQVSAGQKPTVIIEYSQPNIAKKMHVGHLRNTILGEALANIFELVGYQVIRWNYLGDWGTQFGKLIAAYKLWGDKKSIDQNPMEALSGLYVKFHQELKDQPVLEERGRAEFKKLEEGDKENRKLWQWFREESLKEFDRLYQRLGVRFGITRGESAYEKDLVQTVEDLQKRGLVEKSEGALIIRLDRQKLPPALVQKSDGTSVYLTRDLASLRQRLNEYRPEKIIYVVGDEQTLYFQQLFAVADLLGLTGSELIHVKYGLVLGEEGKKLATREGKAVMAEEVIAEAVQRAHRVVKEKNPQLAEDRLKEVAEVVGLGALKYQLLKENRNTDLIFNWRQMLDLTGDSGPYLQYTFARLSSILEKAGPLKKETDLKLLEEEQELKIIKKLFFFPEIIKESLRFYSPNSLTLFLYELAGLASHYYEAVRILGDENQARLAARLFLIKKVTEVLEKGLALLGIKTLNRI